VPKELILDKAFDLCCEWYEDFLSRHSLPTIPQPDDFTFDECKNIFWELEEELGVTFNLLEMKNSLIEAYNFLDDQYHLSDCYQRELKCEFDFQQLQYSI
jgi:hypothetical protein